MMTIGLPNAPFTFKSKEEKLKFIWINVYDNNDTSVSSCKHIQAQYLFYKSFSMQSFHIYYLKFLNTSISRGKSSPLLHKSNKFNLVNVTISKFLHFVAYSQYIPSIYDESISQR